MKKIFVLLFICTLYFSGIGAAQKQPKRFHSINTGGLVAGEKGVDGLFQTVNGIDFNKFFFGVGFGADHYRYRTLPLFADVRRTIGLKQNYFVYGNLGYNFPWKEKPDEETFFYTSYKFRGGLYSDAGAGLTINFYKSFTFVFSTGFSYKEIELRTSVVNPCLVGPCPEEINKYKYNFGTIVIKAGIQF